MAAAAPVPFWGEGFSGKTACVFPIADLSEPPDAAGRGAKITEMVTLGLQSAGFGVVAEEMWRAKAAESGLKDLDLVAGPSLTLLAKSLGADMAVSGYYTFGDGFVTVCVQCIETANGTIVSGILKKDRYNLGFYNALDSEIRGMLEEVGSGFEQSPSLSARVPKLLTELTFTSGLEGMEVVVGGDVIAGYIRNGRLAFETPAVQAGTPIVVEKRLEGYHTATETVAAAAEIPLAPLVKAARFAAEIDWTLGQIMGLGGAFRYNIVPDTLFLSTSHYVYYQAPYTTGANGLIHYDAGIQAGAYLIWGPGESFRLSVSAGFGTVFSFFLAPGLEPATDLYINLINVSAEWNLGSFSLFLRPEMKYTLGIGNDLLGLSTMSWEFMPPITLGAVLRW